jgi:hypothetical protein
VKWDGAGPVLPRPDTEERFVPVEAAGAGFMCIKRRVFERMVEHYPELVYRGLWNRWLDWPEEDPSVPGDREKTEAILPAMGGPGNSRC